MADSAPTNFIRQIVEQDLESGKHKKVVTRFPPEPNGFLHIGHAKSICLNFGLAREHSGICHLRFDDTNPAKEDMKYVDSIEKDVKWLGFEWGKHRYFASDYYEKLYECAVQLIQKEKAYVCSLDAEQMRAYRGTLTEPGKLSPDRDRPVSENLSLFEKMKNGEIDEGKLTLRAKIDMSSPNINLRDPVLYRVIKTEHYRTGKKWCIYPIYDFAHCISDSIEKITHSICTLEFEDRRPLYDWILDTLEADPHPQQIEFSRLNLDYTVLSKRKLLQLVETNTVKNWDDPRMPTLSGMRRRGYRPKAIRNFCEKIGVTKKESSIELSFLENCVREDLDQDAKRVMAVINPLKVILTNYPEGQTEELDANNHPKDPSFGKRKIPFSQEIYIEREDFMEDPPKKFFRLGPGREVRLRYAYFIKCVDFKKDEKGEITELHCTYDPETKGGQAPDGRKVKGTIHWVSAKNSVPATVRLYDRLFETPHPGSKDEDFLTELNSNSLSETQGFLEPSLLNAKRGENFQFERLGYFCLDSDSKKDALVFNRTVTLRDSWAKIKNS